MEKMVKILQLHSIDYCYKSGALYAEEVYTIDGIGAARWINITDWSIKQLYEWLGY